MYLYTDKGYKGTGAVYLGERESSMVVEAVEFYVLVSERLGCDYEEGEKLFQMRSISDAIKEVV